MARQTGKRTVMGVDGSVTHEWLQNLVSKVLYRYGDESEGCGKEVLVTELVAPLASGHTTW